MQDIQTADLNLDAHAQVASFFDDQETQDLDARRRLEIAFEERRLEREMREFMLDYDLDA